MRLRLVAAAVVLAAVIPALALGSASVTTKLTATLTGAAEKPKGPASGKGTAAITISGTKVCWKFAFSGIGKPTAAHIHQLPKGNVVVPFGGAFKASGCTTASAALSKAITANPGGYYVNIHTAQYPGGAIRGQLSKASAY